MAMNEAERAYIQKQQNHTGMPVVHIIEGISGVLLCEGKPVADIIGWRLEQPLPVRANDIARIIGAN